MKSKINLAWKVIVGLPENGIDYCSNNKLFNTRTGKTFLNNIGGISSLDFFPYTLEPTNVFYNAIAASKRDNGFVGKRIPFEFKIDSLDNIPNKLKIKIHRFSSNLVILSCSLSSVEFNGNTDELQNFIQLQSHPEIFKFVVALCGIIRSGGKGNTSIQGKPKTYPYIEIEVCGDNESLQDGAAVEILTRHKNAKPEIVESVIAKNNDHQLDSNSILIDRQGILARYTNNYDEYLSIQRKYESSHNLLELAISISIIFENDGFTGLTSSEKDSITKLITAPNIVFTKSVTAYKTWILLIEEFKLKDYYHLASGLNPSDDGLQATEELLATPTKPEWSEQKKWGMGTLAAILLVFLPWASNLIYKEYDPFSNDKISLIRPIDGAHFQEKINNVLFKWRSVENTKNYIQFIEKYSKSNNKWIPQENGGRYVVSQNTNSILLDLKGRYRWKVISRDSDDKITGDSIWYYFNIEEAKTPNKKMQPTQKTRG